MEAAGIVLVLFAAIDPKMKCIDLKSAIGLVAALLLVQAAFSQTTTVVDTSSPAHATVIAGAQYQRGALHRLLWGKDYRKVWSTPIRVLKLRLDTTLGGLKPTEKAGGTQTRHLRMEAANGRNYSIRSVDKRYGKSLPKELQGTFIEDLVNDQMSAAYPYASVVVKELAAAAGIYNTGPVLYFLPNQPALDSFSAEFANQLYTLEDRPSSDNARYYNAKDVLDTEELVELMRKDPTVRIDQASFAKARLFDLVLGDWDRHKDQWEWTGYDTTGGTVYRALPKDRDQAFSSYDGLIVRMGAKAAKVSMMQPFRDNIRSMEAYTWLYRETDMPSTNQLSLDTWSQAATELQQRLTDAAIEQAVKVLPAEVYPISGPRIVETVKKRRDRLQDFAKAFYLTLAKEVDVLATSKNDSIAFSNASDGKLMLNIYPEGSGQAYFSRTFDPAETKEVRVFGIGGNDRFTSNGTNNSGIKLRLIGGPDKDQYHAGERVPRLYIYDNDDNQFDIPGARLRLSNDSSVHKHNQKSYKRDEFGLLPKLGYTNEDRLFVGLGLRWINHSFRKKPYGSFNEVAARYSITQKAFSYAYNGVFMQVIGKWNIGLLAEYDEVRDQDFLGIGNNTVRSVDERHFYRYRNSEANAHIRLFRIIDSMHTITLAAQYQSVQVLNDPAKYISYYHIPAGTAAFEKRHFWGGRMEYDFTKVDDAMVPRRGLRFNTAGEYMRNLKEDKSVRRLSGLFGFILPVGPFTIASKAGAATLWGKPEFYQLNRLGGVTSLRGYLRFRFYGNTVFYNQNELQLNFNVKTYLFSGKMGLLALYDQARVWQPGENSERWHSAVGGGLMLAPFNRISVTGTYAVSKEDKRFSVRIGHFLK